jgi:hypothetical protein
MAASAFQNTTMGRARITVASPTGIELARMAAFLCHTIGARLRQRPQSVAVELNQLPSEQAATASGQDQHLTKERLGQGRGDYSNRCATAWSKRLRKSRRAVRQRGLPTLLHWPDPQRAAGAAPPLRRVSNR